MNSKIATPQRILVIQTAFIGDAILATPIIEALYNNINGISIDFMVRKGNESLFQNHPKINKLYVWNKKENKYKNLYSLLKTIKKEKYDVVINLQRYASTGLFTILSKAKTSIGFDKNPFAFKYTHSIKFNFGDYTHEVERNLSLLDPIIGLVKGKMKLYPTVDQFAKTELYKSSNYICVAPTSVWYTKQFPKSKWIEFFNTLNENTRVYLLGAPSDRLLCDTITEETSNKNIKNLCGDLSLLESAALMRDAKMNFVNDSAPMHIASSMNAPTTAIYCSTIPAFGFGPRADNAKSIETKKELSCRPCGVHGKKECPEKHYECGMSIEISELINRLN